jgi:hypothetical protein
MKKTIHGSLLFIILSLVHGLTAAQVATSWNLKGNNGTNPATQFIGTTDKKALHFRADNIIAGELDPITGNVFWGLRAGQKNTSGYSNIGIGTDALKLNLSGLRSTAIGDSALYSNTSGNYNTANGYQALFSNSSGYCNTSSGSYSLGDNSNGALNTADGFLALGQNATGSGNTATGAYTLQSNTSGLENTADGYAALNDNLTGYFNTSIGALAMSTNTSGIHNTAVGTYAAYKNDGGYGSYNTAIGSGALFATTNSQYNTTLGYNAGYNHDMGYNNTILGANCDVNAAGLYNCIAIGQGVICTASSQARIGNQYTNSIGGYASWTNFSDGRYKKDVKNDVKGIDFIMRLRPVTYRLDVTAINNKLNEDRSVEIDSSSRIAVTEKESIRFSGFVAQDVETAANESGYDFSGVDKPKNPNDFYGLRYSDFVIPLVKAVQELNKKVETLDTIIEDLQKRLKLLEQKKNSQ